MNGPSSTVEVLPDDHGLLIHLESTSGQVAINCEPDSLYSQIHPNCYAPQCLQDVHLLAGGGSGTAVFHGQHPKLGSIVMKHGGPRDMQEVFSLAEISQQLQERAGRSSSSSTSGDTATLAAAERMKQRIPEFVMVYISPYHIRDRSREFWCTAIRRVEDIGKEKKRRNKQDVLNRKDSGTSSNSSLTETSSDGEGDESSDDDDDVNENNNIKHLQLPTRNNQNGNDPHHASAQELAAAARKKCIRGIKLMDGTTVKFDVYFRFVGLTVPDYDRNEEGGRTITSSGYTFLSSFLTEVVPEQQRQHWKFTVAQKTIGGPNAMNGAAVLTSGELKDELLQRLTEDFICVVRDLRQVTMPDETEGVLESVRKEVEELRRTEDVELVSKMADSFVGSAIRKNFMPDTGRFALLRDIGERFRTKSLILVDNEELPARFLGELLTPGVRLGSVFLDPHLGACKSALDYMEGSWLDLLEHATSFDDPAATDRVWTCGLTDAGLHNLFLTQERGVELFDLGEPQLSPQPAFLTKFFMSFFHAFGMEEDGAGSWVRRFDVVDGKLKLTKESQELMPYCHNAFNVTMDSFIEELFDDDDDVRELLVKYVVLQLLSDCAFCLARWEEKGGGKQRFANRASEGLEKWLWRSIWDFYIASDVHQKMLVDGTDSLFQSFTQSFTLRG